MNSFCNLVSQLQPETRTTRGWVQQCSCVLIAPLGIMNRIQLMYLDYLIAPLILLWSLSEYYSTTSKLKLILILILIYPTEINLADS